MIRAGRPRRPARRMDEQGVRKAILMNSISNPSNTVVKAVQAHPDRFTMSMGGFRSAAAGRPPAGADCDGR